MSSSTRPAEPEDLAQIAAIYAWYVVNSYATFALEAPSDGEWAAHWRRAQAAGHPWTVCELEGAIVGYAGADLLFPKRAYASTVVTSIYLVHSRTGEGLGASLLRAQLQALRRRSEFHRAVASIALPNEASRALHEKFGFRPVGVFHEVGRKLGEWRDVGWWELEL